MSPAEYCEAAAAAPGSTAYYSLLYCPPERRRTWNALLALREELARVSIECRERDVGVAKLRWWQDDLEGLAVERGRHPISLELARVAGELGLGLAPLAALPGAYARLLDGAPFAATAELSRHCADTGGVIHALGARCAASTGEREVAFARALGGAFESAELVFEAPARTRAGRTTFPADDPEGRERSSPIEHSQRLLRGAMDEAGSAGARHQLYLLVRAEIVRSRLRKLARRTNPGSAESADLLPLAKHYIAWRTKRRAR